MAKSALTGGKTFAMGFDLGDLDDFLDELGDDAAKALRPAAQAATQVIYDRVKLNVASLGRVTGNLAESIYQAYSPENSRDGQRAQYNVSWNHKQAPHGHLVEYGYLQRYHYYRDNQGRVRPMVRPGMDGTPRPGRRATQAAKDAYFVTLDSPKQVPGKAFVRSADAVLPQAYMAAENELINRLLKRGSA